MLDSQLFRKDLNGVELLRILVVFRALCRALGVFYWKLFLAR